MADEIASIQKDGVTITSNSGESQAREALDVSATKAAPETETTSEGAAKLSPEVTDKSGESETEPQKKPKRRRHSARSRINELTRKNYELERQLASRPQQDAPAQAKEPQPEDFETYEQYITARSRWEAGQEYERRDTERRQREQQQRAIEQRSKELGSWSERVVAAKEKYPDWDERTEALEGIKLHPALERVLITSEVGPDVLYYLAAHPEVLDDFRVPIDAAIARLGRLEARFLESSSAPKNEKPKVSAAPEPIRPVGAKGDKTSTVEPDKLPYQEFKRWREKSRKAG